MQLGHRLRKRRQELSLSLRELAERVGVTASFLSQVEHDQASPSIKSLRKISEALEVPIFYFLAEHDAKGPVVRRNERLKLTLPDSNLVYELLAPDVNRQMEALMAQLGPGDDNVAMSLRRYTEEFIYVLQGHLEIQLEEKVYTLDPGDSIYFEGSLLRRLAAKGDKHLRFISVITPPIF